MMSRIVTDGGRQHSMQNEVLIDEGVEDLRRGAGGIHQFYHWVVSVRRPMLTA